MTLKLRDLEKPGSGLKKVLRNLARSLRENVEKLPDHPARRIHDLRVCAKKLRSLSRLGRPVLSKKQLRQLTGSLRGLKDAFAGSRDVAVMRSCLESLRPAKAGEIARQLGLPDTAPEEALKTSASRLIRRAKRLESEVEALDLEKLRRADAVKNFLKTYRRAQKLMRACRKSRDAVRMHEWRKRVKDFFYQATALSSVSFLEKAVPRADKLAEILGEYHDLALLAERIRQSPGIEDSPERDVDSRLRKAGETAFKLASSLFSVKPGTLAERLAV